jgi:4-aminobutyrate aminotransferase
MVVSKSRIFSQTDNLLPELITELPGPKAAAIVKRDHSVLSPSYTRCYPLVVSYAKGCLLWDVDGNRFLDFNAGIAVCATGHSHPKVTEAIHAQVDRFIHYAGTDFYYEPAVLLAEKLAGYMPDQGKNWKVFFTNSGTEATEGAVKLARYHTKRPGVIAFYGAFHGRSQGSLGLTASKARQREGFCSPYFGGVVHCPYPAAYRNPFTERWGTETDAVLHYLNEFIFGREIAPADVALLAVEPIQGEGGYIVPTDDFLPRLRDLCRRHGILLGYDEVQSGFGRTGKMFAYEHSENAAPDILWLAKGIASGMPLGAFIAPADVMDWKPGSHGTTFGGNPVSCAAALATLDVIESEGLMQNAESQGNYMLQKMAGWPSKYPPLGDVRGRGLMIGLDFVQDKSTKRTAPKFADFVVDYCFRKGLLLLTCGKSTVRLCPPLTIARPQVDFALEILEEAISHWSDRGVDEVEHLEMGA